MGHSDKKNRLAFTDEDRSLIVLSQELGFCWKLTGINFKNQTADIKNLLFNFPDLLKYLCGNFTMFIILSLPTYRLSCKSIKFNAICLH